MASLNRMCILGNVGADPEIKTMNNGNKVANLSVATSETWKDKTTGEKKEKTEWHRVVIFSQPLVDVVEKYVHKGSKLYLEGSLQTRKWQDNNGMDKYSTEVILQAFDAKLILLDSKPQEQQNQAPNDNPAWKYANQSQQQHTTDKGNGYVANGIDDDIPF